MSEALLSGLRSRISCCALHASFMSLLGLDWIGALAIAICEASASVVHGHWASTALADAVVQAEAGQS